MPLTALVQEGTFSPEAFLVPTAGKAAVNWEVERSYSLPFSYTSEFTVLPLEFDTDGDDEKDLRITPGVLSLDLHGEAQVSCVIRNWRVVALDASVSSQLAAEIRARIEFFARANLFTHTKQNLVPPVPLAYVVGFIGPVPVWVELQLGVDLGLEVTAEAAAVFETGLDAYASSDFRLAWHPGGWDQSYDGNFNIVPVPLDVGFQLSAEAFLYLKPRLSALVYSVAGVSADYRRGPDLEAKWEVGDPQCEITLYDKWSVNAGMTVLGVDDSDLPHVTFLDEKRTIRTWYWPAIAEQSPVFTRHPGTVTAPAGTPVTLRAQATGNPEPEYQWFQNGVGIPFRTQPTLTFTMGSGAAGTYTVMARNRLGWVLSNQATVSLLPSAPVPGMVWIPPGTFIMGSPASEPARYLDEGPQTRVTISRGFWMGRYEVTQAEYLAVMGSNPSYFTGDLSRPVEQVSWDDAVAYCAALTARERNAGRLPVGYAYRLPTEAEWEYACRAGTTTPFHNGSALRSGMANFDGHYEYPPCGTSSDYCYNPSGTYLGRTASVGSYAPNSWGLYDMHGNVWEWCQDWYGVYPGGSVTDPQGAPTGSSRVLRGGGWYYFANICRSALRGRDWPGNRGDVFGFRVVLASGQP